MREDEFVPCRPNCQTCKPGVFKDAGASRMRPTGAPYPIGPSVEPYRSRIPVESVLFAPIRGVSLHGAYVDEAFPPAPRPVPRRPQIAGFLRRLFP